MEENTFVYQLSYLGNHQEILQIPPTHIPSDHNVKADCIRFVERSKFCPVLCLEIFGKSALKDNKTRFNDWPTDWGGHWWEWGRGAAPKVVAFGDGVLGEGRIESRERIPRDTKFHAPVQVTLPLNNDSYFSSLGQK